MRAIRSTAKAHDEAQANIVDLLRGVTASHRRGFFKRLTRDSLLELGGGLFGEDWAGQHGSAKKGGLVETFDVFFNGRVPNDLFDEDKAIRETWLPRGFEPEDGA